MMISFRSERLVFVIGMPGLTGGNGNRLSLDQHPRCARLCKMGTLDSWGGARGLDVALPSAGTVTSATRLVVVRNIRRRCLLCRPIFNSRLFSTVDSRKSAVSLARTAWRAALEALVTPADVVEQREAARYWQNAMPGRVRCGRFSIAGRRTRLQA